MTHDELLERIDELKYDVGDSGMNEESKAIYALRAVVELHKPMPGNDIGDSPLCEDCINTAYIEYPCDTIRAIEKELK